jgi:hypothetical protein
VRFLWAGSAHDYWFGFETDDESFTALSGSDSGFNPPLIRTPIPQLSSDAPLLFDAGTNCDNLHALANKQLQLQYWLKIPAQEGQHQTCCMSSYVDLKLPPVISGMFSMVDLPATKSGRRHLFVSSN